MARLLKRLWANEAGSVALEYALIGSIVSVAVIVGAMSIGASLNTNFANIAPNLK